MTTVVQYVDGSSITSEGIDLDASYSYTSASGVKTPLAGIFLAHTSWGALFKEELSKGYRLILFGFENGLYYGPTLPGTVTQAIELDEYIYFTVVTHGEHRLAHWHVNTNSWTWLSPSLGRLNIGIEPSGKLKICSDHLFTGTNTYQLYPSEIKTLPWKCHEAGPVCVYQSETGSEYILLGSQSAQKTLVSFHGGPESYELLENRYDGFYQELLAKGYQVLICNYPGSSALGMNARKAPWQNWEHCLIQDLAEVISALDLKNVSTFGVSFGGALALITAKHFDTKRVYLSSPLLDLKSQSQRDLELTSYFNTRFSARDYNQFSPQLLLTSLPSTVDCIHSLHDPIISSHTTIEAYRQYRNIKLHTPPSNIHSLMSQQARKLWSLE